MTDLFSPLRIGSLDLPNRIAMSAMTRTRATPENVPTELMAEYFAQRADAGLIVTDCTAVSAQARGVIRGPGIWRDDQISGWRTVTDRVTPRAVASSARSGIVGASRIPTCATARCR